MIYPTLTTSKPRDWLQGAVEALIVLLLCAMTGCGYAESYYPDGKTSLREITFAKNVSFASATTTEKGVRVVKGAAIIDDEAVKAIVAGVVEGVVKSALRP